ncbi:MAG: methyltransferase C-terminal domain-containing protein, partial [Candidatus Methylomirabilis sp.]
QELKGGLGEVETYSRFEKQVHNAKRDILEFLVKAKREGKRIAGYGAPGKGNTLLNYCGIRTDFLDYTVDRSPYKQGRYTPGTRIPILAPETLKQTRPDFVFILPWNLKEEIIAQHGYVRDWGGKFVVPIPSVLVI